MSLDSPNALTPAFSATCIGAGESVCWTRMSAPWLTSTLAASPSLPGSNHEFTQMIFTLKFGLTDCAQSVNPNFKVKIIWVNSWFDPGKEGDAANVLVNQGADILVQHTDSPAPMQVAEKAGVKAFGESSDMSSFGPKAHLASLIDNWGPYYIAQTKAVLDGSWKSQQTWEGFKDNLVQVGPLQNMPDDVKAMANATIDKIKGGWSPFAGPITKQDGSVGVADGKVIADGDLLGLNWFVKGIDDKIPQ